jgi:phosphodiesterase/alkaline phosphatase D-like protein
MDTRTERRRGRGTGSLDAAIVSREQMDDLKRWLGGFRETPDQPKFIVSPSVVAPWLRETRGSLAYSLRSDAWDGFPRSLQELLGFIARERIRNVVFLSGDFHCSLFCKMQLQHGSQEAVPAYSVVSSGLYSPYPFANTPMAHLEREFQGALGDRVGADDMRELRVRYRAHDAGTADSFAIVEVDRAAMKVEFRDRCYTVAF